MINKNVDNGQRIKIWIILFVAILMQIILSSASLAIDASGGSISSRIGSGVISFNNNNYNNSHIMGGFYPASNYYGGSLSGYWGLGSNAENNDTTPPILVVLSPTNNAVRTYTNISFNFTVNDAFGINNCTLYVDTNRIETINLPSNGANSISSNLSGGLHNWSIECYDTNYNRRESLTRDIRIILASNFDNETTDLSSVNISNVPNLTIAKSGFGKIRFDSNTNLENITDLESHITISDMSITIDSAQLPILNKPAKLTIYNIPYDNVAILKDGVICNECTINSYSGGIIVFDVIGFSTYTITSTSKLEISDDTDTIIKEIFSQVGFYANYSNISSGQPISSQCDISFNMGGWSTPVAMIYNSSRGLHEYYRMFNDSNTYMFNVSCQALTSGFDDLSMTEEFIISNMQNGSFAGFNMTVISSDKYNDNRPAGESEADSGNVSEIPIHVEVSSNYWQGYFGNVTGTVLLADSNGRTFYDWEYISASGEILATRNQTIDWNSISCIDSTTISIEDTFLGKNTTDVDSVNSTFNMTAHPSFMISTSVINGCKATRTFRGSAQVGFWNVLLEDNAGSAVYAGIINADNYNYKNSTSDFELLVPAPHGSIHTYYFYLELN